MHFDNLKLYKHKHSKMDASWQSQTDQEQGSPEDGEKMPLNPLKGVAAFTMTTHLKLKVMMMNFQISTFPY